ncbi:MAG: CHC2 zinc finger domain-containing protein [Microthrixaceae bacterium]
MGIVDEDIARVRAASDIVAVVTQHTQLRKVGQRWSGLCPFHNEKSPSFSVNAQEGLYYCFGCQASGDIITFVREIEHLDFVGAVEWLAGKAGIALTYTDDNEREQRKQQSKLFGAMERAVDWYHDRLVSGSDAGAARAYLRSRGFDRDMVEAYRLGWAPDSWDDMVRSLRLPVDVATETGLAFSTGASASKTSSARSYCSRSSTIAVGPSPSADASCPTRRGRSTRTAARGRSTTRAAPCTA